LARPTTKQGHWSAGTGQFGGAPLSRGDHGLHRRQRRYETTGGGVGLTTQTQSRLLVNRLHKEKPVITQSIIVDGRLKLRSKGHFSN